jgi:hypothetical protein
MFQNIYNRKADGGAGKEVTFRVKITPAFP